LFLLDDVVVIENRNKPATTETQQDSTPQQALVVDKVPIEVRFRTNFRLLLRIRLLPLHSLLILVVVCFHLITHLEWGNNHHHVAATKPDMDMPPLEVEKEEQQPLGNPTKSRFSTTPLPPNPMEPPQVASEPQTPQCFQQQPSFLASSMQINHLNYHIRPRDHR
jgi:hypothetical protein